jgi:hypothetical protein
VTRVLRKQTLSMRGEPVDFAGLAASNPTQPTLGNTRTNVRGDLLGDNGVILKTQEQIEQEWARKKALQKTINKASSIKNDSMTAPSDHPHKEPPPADISFPTIGELAAQGSIPSPVKSTRKIVDSD